jgi:hypothetical protein
MHGEDALHRFHSQEKKTYISLLIYDANLRSSRHENEFCIWWNAFTRYPGNINKSLLVELRIFISSPNKQNLYKSFVEEDAMLFSLQLRRASVPTASAQAQLDYDR